MHTGKGIQFQSENQIENVFDAIVTGITYVYDSASPNIPIGSRGEGCAHEDQPMRMARTKSSLNFPFPELVWKHYTCMYF